MTDDRVKTVDPPEYRAQCQGCDWTSTAANALANAARHHDAHGHTVEVGIARTVTFGDPNAPIPAQLAIPATA